MTGTFTQVIYDMRRTVSEEEQARQSLVSQLAIIARTAQAAAEMAQLATDQAAALCAQLAPERVQADEVRTFGKGDGSDD